MKIILSIALLVIVRFVAFPISVLKTGRIIRNETLVNIKLCVVSTVSNDIDTVETVLMISEFRRLIKCNFEKDVEIDKLVALSNNVLIYKDSLFLNNNGTRFLKRFIVSPRCRGVCLGIKKEYWKVSC